MNSAAMICEKPWSGHEQCLSKIANRGTSPTVWKAPQEVRLTPLSNGRATAPATQTKESFTTYKRPRTLSRPPRPTKLWVI